MTKKYATRTSITFTSLLLMSLVGCQKNSYESCIEIQTETATREYNRMTPERRGNITLQKYIDSEVQYWCRGVK